MAVIDYEYNGRLGKLKWKGCHNLWAHGGQNLERQVPKGFKTLGIPGALRSDSLVTREAPMPTPDELDDLVRGLVDDQGEQDEYEPLYIIDYVQIDAFDDTHVYRVAFSQETVWTVNHKSYGWISFTFLADLIEWVVSNK